MADMGASQWGKLLAGLVFGACMSAPAIAAPEVIRQQLVQLQPDLVIEQISAVEGSGLYQVQIKGGQFLYTDAKAEYILHGELYRVGKGEAVNLTSLARQQVTAELMAGLDTKDMVVFPAQDSKAYITVFTDVDCGFCQKLHNEVPQLNQAGVEVRYLAWPRQGLSGTTYDSMVSIWCADDPQTAMTRAKRRQAVTPAQCKHPIDRQYALGQQLGLSGTPAIVLENGELVPGYMPAAQLVAKALQAKQ